MAEERPGTLVQAPFFVVGKSGRPILAVTEGDAGPQLALLDASGQTVLLLLLAGPDGGRCAVRAPTGEAGAQFAADAEDGGRLVLTDPDGAPAVVLTGAMGAAAAGEAVGGMVN
jgi:hypothetical protein